jgi:SAM-dependent methyltransferase
MRKSHPYFYRLHSKLHGKLTVNRRLKMLSSHIQSLLPEKGTVLDIGCGSGGLSRIIQDNRPELRFHGVDVLKRQECYIPIELYDGKVIPFEAESFDYVMFIDVLHHTDDPFGLIKEGMRVSRNAIIIKDHLSDNRIARKKLALMDWIGNKYEGVRLPYNYYSSNEWLEIWKRIGTHPVEYITNLNLYPYPLNLVFEANLHFIALIPKSGE